MSKKRVSNRIIALSQDSDELDRLYAIIKKYAKNKGMYLGSVLKMVFKEFINKHKLGEINEQLRDSNDVQEVPSD